LIRTRNPLILAVIQKLNQFAANGKIQVEITKLDLPLPRLGQQFDRFRLVQFSDLHIGTWLNKSRLNNVIEQVNQQNPDLIAITGDFVTFEPERFAGDLVDAFKQLKSKHGVVAILGNHDHWTDASVVRQVFCESGINDLSNRVLTLHRGADQLHIAGVDDVLENLADLDRVLEQIPAEGEAILLAHEPDFADISASSGRFSLQISGHTHGGQVVLPWVGPPILPPRGRKYPSGRYQINGMVQYTNRGVGTTSIQLRLNCPPEITVFNLLSPEN
jgi:predicted MPP superfamily phosphohydrolase